MSEEKQYTPSHTATLLIGVPWFTAAWAIAYFYHQATATPDQGATRLLDLVVPHAMALFAILPAFVPVAIRVIKWDKRRQAAGGSERT